VNEIRIGRALLSVSDKTGLTELATGLARHGVKIVSTGGTAATLRDGGISVRDVGEITGFPELFGGRVKTLHPAVHGGILYRRGNRMDEEERHHHGIVSIELVVVNLYPFEKTIGRPGVSDAEAVEQIDIGGPALIRAAAKNHAHVLTVVDPDQYAEVLEALDRGQGAVPAALARKFARRAYERTSTYDAAIAGYLAGASANGKPSGALPERIEPRYRLLQKLRYGENPGQEGGVYAGESNGGIATLAQLKGKVLSYNNYLDIEAALSLLHEFEEPAAVVVKHRNPAGAAVAPTVASAIPLARDADSLSAFGGILGINRPLDDAALEAIGSIFLEVVIAPSITASPDRLEKTRKNLMVLEAPDLLRGAASTLATRSLLGGLLAETLPGPPQFASWMAVTARKPTEAETRDLRFAWRVTRHVISNAIVIARDGVTLGIGAGQSSRVDAVRLALLKAERSGHSVEGAVLCSDAFFPFPDSVEMAAKAGITAIAQPGGSVRDEESIAAAESRGLTMLLTGERCFLH
jgi:phosphoribosylaminoimidazolecarboxamide formyltransferase/IMP cyclohydrolase